MKCVEPNGLNRKSGIWGTQGSITYGEVATGVPWGMSFTKAVSLSPPTATVDLVDHTWLGSRASRRVTPMPARFAAAHCSQYT